MHSRSLSRALARPFVLFLLASTAALHAHNAAPSAVRLDPYEVNDPRFVRDETRPAASHKIEGGQLDLMNLANLEDSLKYAPNVFVRKRFIGDQNGALVVRGTHTAQSARSLVLADGLVLSNFLGSGHGFAPRWGLVAPEEIESVEVVYGPYSALYPGNALGGVVLFTTGFPSSFLARAKTSFFFNDYQQYATNKIFRGHQHAVSVGDRHGRFTWFAFYNRLENESNPTDFRTILLSATTAAGGGTPVTGVISDPDLLERPRLIYGAYGIERVDQDQLKLKLAYDVGSSARLSGSLVYFRRDVDTSTDTYLRDATGNPVYSGRVDFQGRSFTIGAADFGHSRRQETDLLASLALRGRTTSGWDYAALASAFIVADDATRASTQSGPAAANRGPGLLTCAGNGNGWRNFDFKTVREFATSFVHRHAVALGYHYDLYRLETEQFNTSDWIHAGPGSLRDGQTGQTSTHALFAQDAWRFAPAWNLTAGLRYERWHATDGTREIDTADGRVRTPLAPRDEHAFSPKFSVAWRPTRDWVARLSAGRAHRFATVSELYQGITAADGTVTANDPNLRTERAWSTDLTLERTLARGHARATFYQDDAHDTIYSQTSVLTRLTNFQNIARVRTRGVELALDRRGFLADAIDLQLSLAYTEAIIRANPDVPASVGKTFPRIPRWRGTLFATWHATSALHLTAGWRYASREFNQLDNADRRSTYGGVSGYSLIDLRAGYDLGRHITASLGVDNVTRFKYYQSHNLQQRVAFAELQWRY